MATRAGLGPGSKYFLKALASSSRAPPLKKKKPCQNPPPPINGNLLPQAWFQY